MSQAISLAERQEGFMRSILDDAAPLPPLWIDRHAAGLDVYRGNYRSALMGALEDTFERTNLYVGHAPFAQAAAHHAIAHPPTSWTIDNAGKGFEQTCAQLFAKNPEVAELAWLEWTMLELARAADAVPIDAAQFAQTTQGLTDQQWSGLRLEFQPNAAARLVEHNLTAIWNALSEEGSTRPDPALSQERGCLVWREGERPTFMLVDADEALAFQAMQDGAPYGAMLVQLAHRQTGGDRLQKAVAQGGAMLGNWLEEGMITRVIA